MSGSSDDRRGPVSTEITLNPRRVMAIVLVACIGAELAFVLLDYHVNYGGLIDIGAIRRLFNIAREDGLASWFGTAQTMLVALTLWALYAIVRRQAPPGLRRTGWLVLALMFSWMTIDDGAQLHERLGTTFGVLRERADPDALQLFPSYNWQILFVPVFGALGLFMAWFLWRELPAVRLRWAVLAALGCLGLAVGLDFIEGLDREHAWNLYGWAADRYDFDTFTRARFRHGEYTTLRHFSRSLEEFLEMLAMTVLWAVFLERLTAMASDLRVRFRSASPSSSSTT